MDFEPPGLVIYAWQGCLWRFFSTECSNLQKQCKVEALHSDQNRQEEAMKIQKILAPVDFSEYSDKAVELALVWGEEFGAELTLLHVNTLFHEQFDYDRLAEGCQDLVRQHETRIRQQLEEHARRIRKRAPIRYEIMRATSAAAAILKTITEDSFDLVILGTHGRTGLKHLLSGSVAEKVARLSPVPVLTVHGALERYEVKNILVPVDFSQYSPSLVKNALAISKAFEARVHLLHVLERPTAASFSWMTEKVEPYFELNPELRERALNKMNAYLPESAGEAILKVIESGHAYEEIVRYAAANRIDLILMATRGFSKFDYFWLWGSTTERVVRLAPCSVLTEREADMAHLSELAYEEAGA